MKQIIPVLFFFSLIGCSGKQNKEEERKNENPKDVIYPVSSFFNEQIREVDSLKLPTVMYRDINSRKDTAAISMESFRALAKDFIESDISNASLGHQYMENSFADQSIPSITLNYTTKNTTLPVQRIDVILDPNPVANDEVKTVYIEKKERQDDTLIIKKLYWKSHRNFQVITSKKLANKPEIISQVKVAWDNYDELNQEKQDQ